VERETRVDDVLDDQDVAVSDRGIEVLQDPDDARGVGRRAVARHRHEVELAVDGQAPHQVGEEGDRALQDRDQQGRAALVVAADLGAELGDPPLQLVLRDEHLADRVLAHGRSL
jgi:hypothetical protein